jgi:hypothetical protein
MFVQLRMGSAFGNPYSPGAFINPAHPHYGVWYGGDEPGSQSPAPSENHASESKYTVVFGISRPGQPAVELTGLEGGMIMAALFIVALIVAKLYRGGAA